MTTVSIAHTASVNAVESATADAVGESDVLVRHDLSYSRRGEDFHDIWSKLLSVAVGPPEILDLADLDMMRRANKDLFTSQEIALFAMANTGGNIVNVTFKTDGNDTLEAVSLMSGAYYQESLSYGHLNAQPVKTIELQALTGPVELEMLIATKLAS